MIGGVSGPTIQIRGRSIQGRPFFVALLAFGTFGCGGGDEPGPRDGSPAPAARTELAEWSLSESPMLEIGVREGEEPYQLHRVRGSALLEGGDIVVLNAGSHELRYYDAEGRFLESVGGMGEGPGEFRNPTGLRRREDGSLQVWDQGLMRLSVFQPDGRYLASSNLMATREEMFPGDDWLLGQNWIVSPVPPGARGPIREAVSQLPPPDSVGTLRILMVTPQGRIWSPNVRPPADSAVTWQVFDLDAGPVATITTPPRFQPHEIGEDYLTGVFLDEVDVNYVRVYEIRKPDGSLPGPGLEMTGSPTQVQVGPPVQPSSDETMAAIRSLMKNLASLEEIYYSNHYTYTRDLDALLESFRGGVPDGLAVDILFAGSEGWALMVSHPESGGQCIMAYGFFVPMGWQPGSLICF